MRLQVALDFDDMQQCLNVADCVNAYVDILECGPDLLVRYGMDAVKTLRERYPQKTILCDQKIMDGGHYFGCMANDFGADIFTVLGVSADETVKGAIAAARERNIQVLVDMCSVPDYKARAVQIRSWGADYICIHTPTDQQAEYSFHEHVGEIADLIGAEHCAVAGGIDPQRCQYLRKIQPEIVIVGSFITYSNDPLQAVKEIREALYGETIDRCGR